MSYPSRSSCSSGVLVEPLNVTTTLPDSNFASPVHLDEGATSVLLAIEPLSVVNTAIFPLENALALTLIVNEEAFVLFSVGPLE